MLRAAGSVRVLQALERRRLVRPESVPHGDGRLLVAGAVVERAYSEPLRAFRVAHRFPLTRAHFESTFLYASHEGIGLNPCGEIPLEDKEVCNLSETLPTRCKGTNDWLRGCRYASFYSSTVSLLPTHQRDTNAIILKNRRIGVSMSGIADWVDKIGAIELTRILRTGYHKVREIKGFKPKIETVLKDAGLKRLNISLVFMMEIT